MLLSRWYARQIIAGVVSITHWHIERIKEKIERIKEKIERIISLLSTSPEGEVRCRCQNGMAYKD
jgi:uncharacterized protein YigA (DUF484 family)